MTFIDQHREVYGVEPICSVLPIAPSTYYRGKVLSAYPERRSIRAKRDEHLKEEIARVWEDNHKVYGARKVWKQLKCHQQCKTEPPQHLKSEPHSSQ